MNNRLEKPVRPQDLIEQARKHPPRLYAAAFALGFLLDLLIPLGLFDYWLQFMMGMPTIIAAIALFVWLSELGPAKKDAAPAEVQAALAALPPFRRGGPYNHTRHPRYAAITLLYLGFALLFDWPWALMLLAGVIYLMNRYVIGPEEEALAAAHGEEFLLYRSKVKRWWIF